MEMYKLDYMSPIGMMELVATQATVESILFVERDEVLFEVNAHTPDVLKWCYREIDDYFKKNRRTFTFPVTMAGTTFQRDVWQALTIIPYAETMSYRELARHIGRERAMRAVGSANGRNRLTIVVPCHRVIGSNGTLTGYAGGLWRKEWLLHHEQESHVRA